MTGGGCYASRRGSKKGRKEGGKEGSKEAQFCNSLNHVCFTCVDKHYRCKQTGQKTLSHANLPRTSPANHFCGNSGLQVLCFELWRRSLRVYFRCQLFCLLSHQSLSLKRPGRSRIVTSYVLSWPLFLDLSGKTLWGQGKMWRRIHKCVGRDNCSAKRIHTKLFNHVTVDVFWVCRGGNYLFFFEDGLLNLRLGYFTLYILHVLIHGSCMNMNNRQLKNTTSFRVQRGLLNLLYLLVLTGCGCVMYNISLYCIFTYICNCTAFETLYFLVFRQVNKRLARTTLGLCMVVCHSTKVTVTSISNQ